MVGMAANLVDENWKLIRQKLPAGWRSAAKRKRAIRHRVGPLAKPEVLLRMVLGHAASNNSFGETAVHAKQTGLAAVSKVALFKRERNCGDWLEWIANAMLRETMSELPEQALRLRLIDATCASRPGSTGTDFRLHVCVDLPDRRFSQAELTDKRGGETFERFCASPGDVMVGDRGYASARGIGHVALEGAYSLVRTNASSLPLFGADGCRIDPLALARSLAPGEMMEVDADVRPRGQEPVLGRLCLLALPEQEARKAQRRATRRKNSKQRRPGVRAVESAKYVFIFTTVPRHLMSTAQVFAVYRLRWQVELAFKTMKTVLRYGELPNRRADTGRTWLLAKLVCALLLDSLIVEREAAHSPPEDAHAAA
jgi:hypothetical protein